MSATNPTTGTDQKIASGLHRTPREGHVLVTGATGFVGKVVLAELMRRRRELGIDTVYLLIRAKKNKPAQARFDEDIAGSACFSLLTEDWRRCCKVIDGELSLPSCGMSPADFDLLTARVTHIIHCAASVEFDLPIQEAAAANITSCLNMIELAKECERLRQMVAVSTAYVTPHKTDTTPVHEVLAALPRDASAIYRSIVDGTADEKALLRETGHPNTYTFTKCVAEHLLMERRGDVPLTIVRPSIISACWRKPFPGWIDSAAAFAGFVALIGSGHMRVVAADRAARLDVIPCDEVANCVIACALELPPPSEPTIRYATAGLEHNCRVDTSVQIIADFYRRHPIDRTPQVHVIGSPSKRFALHTLRHHGVPTRLAKTWFAITQQPKMARQVRKLGEKLAYVNGAFPYFTHKTFDFQSKSPLLGKSFHREDYIELVCRGVYRHLMKRDETEMSLGGRKHKDSSTDLQWALGQPDGNWAIRTFAFAVRKALRQCTNQVTFDRPSFEAAVTAAAPGSRFVLIPTHRSYMDFLLCSYLFFARRDLGIQIPHIAAAEEFSRIPILGELFKKTHAFYLKRGVGKPDESLTQHVHGLVQRGETVQFFIEGARSRSRQFLAPRTGLLRCLQASGETFTLLPISLTYDRVPEEDSLLRELRGHPKAKMQLRALLAWTQRLAKGEVSLGRVHIRCGEPVTMRPDADVKPISRAVMAQLQQHTAVTTFHLRCFLRHAGPDAAGMDVHWLRDAIERRGGLVVDSPLDGEAAIDTVSEQCMRYNWLHLFYADAHALWPEHPALAHHIAQNGYLPLTRKPGEAELRDPRLHALLRALFEPIGRDYARVAERLGTPAWPPRHTSPRSVLYEVPDAHLPHVQAAFEDLVQREVLAADATHGYAWGAKASDLQDYHQACAWPGADVETQDWRQAVSA